MSRELFSIEAEHGVLGAIMLDPSLFDVVTSKVSISDFYDLENAALFKAIIDCHATGDPIDPVTIGLWRPTLPSGDSMLAFAVEIATKVPSTANWKTYARHVRERAILWRVVEAGDVIREQATEDLPLAEIIALAQQATADLRDLDDDGQRDYYRASEILPGVVDTIDSKYNKTMPTGLTAYCWKKPTAVSVRQR